ncbi:MAG TPA: hypothetical protein VKD67_02130 [Acidimicrobiales bacterium]|nr:hypothetical protein [Acidimicrobiales bacterium]
MGRSAQRCSQCGVDISGTDVYCAACGTPTGNLSFEPVEPRNRRDSVEVAMGAPRRRWTGPAALIAVAAVAIGVVVISGRGGGTAAPPTTMPPSTATASTATQSTTSTVSVPTTSTSVFSSLVTGRPFEPGADGLVVYLGVGNDELARVDLGAGTIDRRVLAGPTGGGPWMALGRRGGAVIASARGDQTDVYGLADGAASVPKRLATWEETGDGGSTSPQAAPAAEPDEVWVWHEGGTNGTTVRRMRLDGTVTAGPVTLPKFATLLGPDGPGALALAGPDGLYRANIDGQSAAIDRIWPRVPMIVTPTTFVDLVCSDGLDCHLSVVDRATGATRPVATPAGDVFNGYYYGFAAPDTLSPDGRWLAHLEYSGQSPRLVVYDLVDGGVAVDRPIMGSFYGGIRSPPYSFSTDGRFLLFVDTSGTLGAWRVGSTDPPHKLVINGVASISSMSILP